MIHIYQRKIYRHSPIKAVRCLGINERAVKNTGQKKKTLKVTLVYCTARGPSCNKSSEFCLKSKPGLTCLVGMTFTALQSNICYRKTCKTAM